MTERLQFDIPKFSKNPFLIPNISSSCYYLIVPLPSSPFRLLLTTVPHASAISPRFESWIVMGHKCDDEHTSVHLARWENIVWDCQQYDAPTSHDSLFRVVVLEWGHNNAMREP